MNLRINLLLATLVFVIPLTAKLDPTSKERLEVSIMTLNVQNLFDNIDDPGKDDKAYLPIQSKQSGAHRSACAKIRNRNWRKECLNLDWSDAAIDHKLSVLGNVIRQVDDGEGADIVAVQEVENIHILDRLRQELERQGYRHAVLIEGRDNRGIDVGFLSKLPVVGESILHPFTVTSNPDRAGDTRGVLQTQFRLPDGTTMTGFVVHFPAPFHPTNMRVDAYQHLQKLLHKLPSEELAFAAGDFNTTSTEDAREKILEKLVRSDWQVAHDLCDSCKGTYYYAPDDNWSFLDMVLVSAGRGVSAVWGIKPGSTHIANKLPDQVTKRGTPARYRPESKSGASDHWPLVVTLQSRTKPTH